MKSNKLLKLFLILSIFSICPINAMEKKASFAGLGSFIKAKTISAVHSLQSKITLKNSLYLLGEILVVGGILYYLLWPKYKAYTKERKEKLREEKHLAARKKRVTEERERREKEDKELLKELNIGNNINDREFVLNNFIKRVNNPNNIPKNINMMRKDSRGCTLLYSITCNCNSHKLQYVIDNCKNGKGAINIQNSNGDTPLHTAFKYCEYDNFVLLLEYGADPTITNYLRETCTKIEYQVQCGYTKMEIKAKPQKYIDAVDYYTARKDRKLKEFLGNRSNKEKRGILKITCKYGHKKTFFILNNLAPNRFSPIIIIQNPDYMFGGNLLFIFLHKMNIDVPDLVYIYKGNYTNKEREELAAVINFYLEQKNCSPDRFKKMKIAKKMRKNLFRYYFLMKSGQNIFTKTANNKMSFPQDCVDKIISFINLSDFPVGIPIKKTQREQI